MTKKIPIKPKLLSSRNDNMFLKTTLLLVVTIFCWLSNVAANNYFDNNYSPQQNLLSITGQVSDSTGLPLQGVSVNVEGTTVGTVTDANGNYKLSVPDSYAGKSLTFSFTGFESQVVLIGDKNVINVSLVNTGGALLSDVVVVGYGTQRKSDLKGSVKKISSKSEENKPVTNTH